MKYAIRAVKYFVYIVCIVAIVIGALMALGIVESEIDKVFRNGYNSLWQIALMFAALSAFYPLFGYMKKTAQAGGTLAERKAEIVKYMESKNYVLSKEEGETLKFRRRSFLQRLSRSFEDTVTVKQEFGGFELEGIRKDVVILSIGLETALGGEQPQE